MVSSFIFNSAESLSLRLIVNKSSKSEGSRLNLFAVAVLEGILCPQENLYNSEIFFSEVLVALNSHLPTILLIYYIPVILDNEQEYQL